MTWVHKWLTRAKGDLLMAHHAIEDVYPRQLEICCYECQQAVEKALKSYLTYKEYRFPFTHELFKLCALCADFDERFNDYADDCADLTPYAVSARYPDDDDMEEPEAKTALKKAERILTFIDSLIPPEKEQEN
jgi:HEPN domain-containing protein